MNDLLISRNGDPAFGALTLSLPFMPAMTGLVALSPALPCLCFCGFEGLKIFLDLTVKKLPLVHLFHNYKTLQKITSLHKEIASLKDKKVIDTKNEELKATCIFNKS